MTHFLSSCHDLDTLILCFFFIFFCNTIVLPFNGIFPFTDKTVTPNSVNDLKLIHAGKVLADSNKTLADSRITFGDNPTGAITMHVVVQPPVAKKKTGLFNLLFLSTLFNLFICSFAQAVWLLMRPIPLQGVGKNRVTFVKTC